MSSARNELMEVAMSDSRYAVEAYEFLCQALAYTQQHVTPAPPPSLDESEAIHHVTGQALCEGIRQLALDQFGLMAPTVFRCWGVQDTLDFGKMVYYLIDAGLWHKSETDSIEDFRTQFNIDEAFSESKINWQSG